MVEFLLRISEEQIVAPFLPYWISLISIACRITGMTNPAQQKNISIISHFPERIFKESKIPTNQGKSRRSGQFSDNDAQHKSQAQKTSNSQIYLKDHHQFFRGVWLIYPVSNFYF